MRINLEYINTHRHKECRICGEDKLLNEFYKDSDYEDGCMNTCKVCHNGTQKYVQKQLRKTSKKCSICKKMKAYSEFHKNDSHPDGLQSKCIECTNKTSLRFIKKDLEYNNQTQSKICPKCKERKSYTEFWKSSKRVDGLQANCKSCAPKKPKNYHKNKRIQCDLNAQIKRCYGCRRRKPFSEFSIDKSALYGLNRYCRECFKKKYKNEKKN